MKKRNQIRICLCPCNRELESQYKGRKKIFKDGNNCRKIWHNMTKEEQEERLIDKKNVEKLLNR